MLNYILKKIGWLSEPSPELGLLIKNGATLLDVRTKMEFSAGSASGAINIPLRDLGNQIENIDQSSDLVVFCQSGVRSAKAKRILMENGIFKVTDGGTWKAVKRLKEQSDSI